jgi:hypothetical protein
VAALKRWGAIAVAATATVFAVASIRQFVVMEGPAILGGLKARWRQIEEERKAAPARARFKGAKAALERLGARVTYGKGNEIEVHLSWEWHGNNSDLAELTPVSAGVDRLDVAMVGSRFDDDTVHYIAAIPNLRSLYLYRTQVTDEGLRELWPIRGVLQKLCLNHTGITDAGLTHLEGFEQLRTLCLTGTQVSGPGLISLAGLSKLEMLSLRATEIGDDGLEHLPPLRSLWLLDIEDTPISDAGLAHLWELRALKCLFPNGSRVTPAGHSALRKAIPSLYPLSEVNRRREFE